MANHPYENVTRSPISKQQNIQSTNSLDDNCFSLSKMRSEIDKLKPEDLEETMIKKPTTQARTNGPNEPQLEIEEEYQLLYAQMRHTEYFLALVKQSSQENSLNISLKHCSCVILQINNGIT
jgi:hypothetical protein